VDGVVLGPARGIVEPLPDFGAALLNVDLRGASDDALEGEVVLAPKPAEGEEGKPGAPRGGKDHMRLWVMVQDASQLADAAGRKDMLVGGLVGIQHPVNVEEEDVEQHRRESKGCVKPILVGGIFDAIRLCFQGVEVRGSLLGFQSINQIPECSEEGDIVDQSIS
jgi:hypothetical protein